MGPGTKLRQSLTQLAGSTGHGKLHKDPEGFLAPLATVWLMWRLAQLCRWGTGIGQGLDKPGDHSVLSGGLSGGWCPWAPLTHPGQVVTGQAHCYEVDPSIQKWKKERERKEGRKERKKNLKNKCLKSRPSNNPRFDPHYAVGQEKLSCFFLKKKKIKN